MKIRLTFERDKDHYLGNNVLWTDEVKQNDLDILTGDIWHE